MPEAGTCYVFVCAYLCLPPSNGSRAANGVGQETGESVATKSGRATGQGGLIVQGPISCLRTLVKHNRQITFIVNTPLIHPIQVLPFCPSLRFSFSYK